MGILKKKIKANSYHDRCINENMLILLSQEEEMFF
jgi:hypothetical protein